MNRVAPAARLATLALVAVGAGLVGLQSTAAGDGVGSATPDGLPHADTGGTVVLVGATLVDGTGAPPVPDAALVIRGGRVLAVGATEEVEAPAGARRLDVGGRWITPGLIDAHVHFSQSGWFDGRPDALDLRDVYPYPEASARLRRHAETFLEAYLCSGVTTVFDVGGYPWTVALQRRADGRRDAPRVVAAGPLLSTIDFWLNLPEARQFIHMSSDSAVRNAVEALAARGVSAVKVWYLFPPEPPDSARMQGLLRTTARAAEAAGLPLIVHATGLWQAKDAVRAGADVLVHSVFDDPVDEEFVRLARDHGVIYTPTVTVLEGYRNAYAEVALDSLPYPLSCVDDGTLDRWRRGIPESRGPSPEALERRGVAVRRRMETAVGNLRLLHEAGVTVAMGTDAGNPGTLHGPSVHREMELYLRAGLSPAEVLVTATRNAARAAGREDLGTLEPGQKADFLLLEADPTASLEPLRRPLQVWKAGVRVWPAAADGG